MDLTPAPLSSIFTPYTFSGVVSKGGQSFEQEQAGDNVLHSACEQKDRPRQEDLMIPVLACPERRHGYFCFIPPKTGIYEILEYLTFQRR